MKYFYRIFISIFLACLILFQGGGFAHACHCLAMTVQKHHCCPEKQQEQQKSPCLHHQKANKLDVSPTELSTSQACHCEMGSQPQQATEPTEAFSFKGQFILLDVVATAPVQEVARPIGQKPIWLRRLYYPDKASHYIETIRLLI